MCRVDGKLIAFGVEGKEVKAERLLEIASLSAGILE